MWDNLDMKKPFGLHNFARLCLISIVLLLIGVWIASHASMVSLSYCTMRNRYSIDSSLGAALISWTQDDPALPSDREFHPGFTSTASRTSDLEPVEWAGGPVLFRFAGLCIAQETSLGYTRITNMIHLRYWLLVVLCVAATTAMESSILWKRIWSPISPSGCQQCGYDLRAHHRGEKCPECGTLIPTKSATIIAEKGAPHDHS